MLPIFREAIQIGVEAESSEQAIRIAGGLLVSTDQVSPSYVDAMVDAYHDLGPYIVLAPGIAIPHARPEGGVKAQCLAFVRLQTPVKFGHPINDPVRLVMPIGGLDKDFHIAMLQSLSRILMDQAALQILQHAESVEEIYAVFQSGG